jgi:septal ring factor EnvC (AmiA/AmiB activator)
MTPAQQQREIARQAREMAATQRAAERERAAAQRRARADARQHDRMVETGVRTAGRVLTSRAGQDIIRGVLGTLFGGKR